MGHGDDVGSRQETVVGEVGDVGGHHTGVQRRQHGFIVYDLAPGQIDDPHAPLHGGDGAGVDHVGGLFRIVDVHGDVIRPLIKIVDILYHMNVAVQPQSGIHGQKRIVAVHIHAQRDGGVGHDGADGSQTDNAQSLFIKLRADEGRLALFHHGGDIHPGGCLFPDPADGTGNVPGAHQHGTDHQFLHGVGVGAGGGKHRDTRRCAAVQRNVVDPYARTGNGQQTGVEFQVQQLGGAD